MKTFKSKRRPRIVRLMALLALVIGGFGSWVFVQELRPRWAFAARFERVQPDLEGPKFFRSKDSDAAVWWLLEPPPSVREFSGRQIRLENALLRLAFETKSSLLLKYSAIGVYPRREGYWPLQQADRLDLRVTKVTSFEKFLTSLEKLDIRIERGFRFEDEDVLIVSFEAGMQELEGQKPEDWDYAICDVETDGINPGDWDPAVDYGERSSAGDTVQRISDEDDF